MKLEEFFGEKIRGPLKREEVIKALKIQAFSRSKRERRIARTSSVVNVVKQLSNPRDYRLANRVSI